jgi:hypothetical protein
MKIKTKIIEEREANIELPIFRKEFGFGSTSYIAIIEESHVISIYDNKESGHTTVTVAPFWIKESDVFTALTNWQEITEEEFLEAHETALKSLSLRPELSEVDREIEKELAEKDDLKDINI